MNLDFILRTLRTEFVGARWEVFTAVSTDSRTVSEGALFVALTGPTFNGHDFIAAAMDNGAAGAVIERRFLERGRVMLGRKLQRFTLVPVADTLRALGDLAAARRLAITVKIVAITGSNGKTTTKEMTAAVLGEVGAVAKTEGNLNNLIGLPLTVFKIGKDHAFAVLEMGMNQPGEIARLAEIARPDVALVTNVHPAHLEGLGTVETIADEKMQVYGGLGEAGIAVINADDPLIAARAGALDRKRLTFGTGPTCDVRLTGAVPVGSEGQRLNLSIQGARVETTIPHLGRHNALNAAAAATIGLACGVSPAKIAEGLGEAPIMSRRLEHAVVGGVHVLNDAYNANPKSMEGALDTLVGLRGEGRAFAVLGDMLELGPQAAPLHLELGRAVAARGFAALIVLGSESANTVAGAVAAGMDPGACFKAIDAADAAWLLKKRARPGDWVVIKGSRGMKMELVLEHFTSSFSGG